MSMIQSLDIDDRLCKVQETESHRPRRSATRVWRQGTGQGTATPRGHQEKLHKEEQLKQVLGPHTELEPSEIKPSQLSSGIQYLYVCTCTYIYLCLTSANIAWWLQKGQWTMHVGPTKIWNQEKLAWSLEPGRSEKEKKLMQSHCYTWDCYDPTNCLSHRPSSYTYQQFCNKWM